MNCTQEAAASMLGAFFDLKNAALAERIDCYRKTGRSLHYCDQTNPLKAVRAIDERLASHSYTAAEQLLRRVDSPSKPSFGGCATARRPASRASPPTQRFDSIEFRVGDGLGLIVGKLRIQGIPGWLKINWHRPLLSGAKLGHAVLSRRADRWQIAFLVELPDLHLAPRRPAPVGIDVGLTHLIATSDGQRVETPHWARRAAAGLRRQRGFQRWLKAKRELARYRAARVAHQRRDFVHRLSTALVRAHTHFAVEDLTIRGLARGRNAWEVANAAWGPVSPNSQRQGCKRR